MGDGFHDWFQLIVLGVLVLLGIGRALVQAFLKNQGPQEGENRPPSIQDVLEEIRRRRREAEGTAPVTPAPREPAVFDDAARRDGSPPRRIGAEPTPPVLAPAAPPAREARPAPRAEPLPRARPRSEPLHPKRPVHAPRKPRPAAEGRGRREFRHARREPEPAAPELPQAAKAGREAPGDRFPEASFPSLIGPRSGEEAVSPGALASRAPSDWAVPRKPSERRRGLRLDLFGGVSLEHLILGEVILGPPRALADWEPPAWHSVR